MLTYWDVEVLAYFNGEGFVCRDCAVKATSTLTIEKVDAGLCDALDRVSRYELVSDGFERGFDRALGYSPDFGVESRVDRFIAEHPALGDWFAADPERRRQVELRMAYREGVENCFDCGRRLTPLWSEPDPIAEREASRA